MDTFPTAYQSYYVSAANESIENDQKKFEDYLEKILNEINKAASKGSYIIEFPFCPGADMYCKLKNFLRSKGYHISDGFNGATIQWNN